MEKVTSSIFPRHSVTLTKYYQSHETGGMICQLCVVFGKLVTIYPNCMLNALKRKYSNSALPRLTYASQTMALNIKQSRRLLEFREKWMAEKTMAEV